MRTCYSWASRIPRLYEPLNSSFFADPTGAILGRYDQIKLVPFGEYVFTRLVGSIASPRKPAISCPENGL